MLTNKLTARCADFLQLRLLMYLVKTFTVGYLYNEPCPEPRKLFMHLWSSPALPTQLGTILKRMNIRCWKKLISLFPQFVNCRWFVWYRSASEADIEARSMKHAATEQCIDTSSALSAIVLPPPIPFTSIRCRLRVSGYSDQGLIRICSFVSLFYIYLCTICFMVRIIDYITSHDDVMNK